MFLSLRASSCHTHSTTPSFDPELVRPFLENLFYLSLFGFSFGKVNISFPADHYDSAFSSIITDTQFAPLGVVLFAILAELCHKLQLELPADAKALSGETEDTAEIRASTNAEMERVVKEGLPREEEDLGEVVQWEELLTEGLQAAQEEAEENPLRKRSREQAPPRRGKSYVGGLPTNMKLRSASVKEKETATRGSADLAANTPHSPLHSSSFPEVKPSKRRKLQNPADEDEEEDREIGAITKKPTAAEKGLNVIEATKTIPEGSRKTKKRKTGKDNVIDELFGGLI